MTQFGEKHFAELSKLTNNRTGSPHNRIIQDNLECLLHKGLPFKSNILQQESLCYHLTGYSYIIFTMKANIATMKWDFVISFIVRTSHCDIDNVVNESVIRRHRLMH